jgi:hypothetical protein
MPHIPELLLNMVLYNRCQITEVAGRALMEAEERGAKRRLELYLQRRETAKLLAIQDQLAKTIVID